MKIADITDCRIVWPAQLRQRMKIVAIHTDFRIYWPARLRHLSNSLQKRGDSLTVIEIAGRGSAYAFAEEAGKAGMDWICLFPNERMEDLDPATAKKAAMAKLDELNPDVVMAGAIAFTSGAAAVDWAKRNRKAVVIFDDSKKEDVKRNRLVDAIKRVIYASVDAVFCPAEDWQATYRYWGFRKAAVFCGVDVVDNAFWRKDIPGELPGLPGKYFLTAGRQVKRKNFRTVIDAFVEIKKNPEYSNLALILAGDGEERTSLEDAVPETDRPSVYFYPFQSQSSLRTLYRQAQAFILPSTSEQWGLVVNEAMASGSPVIVSRPCGCVKSLVAEGENGLVFSPENTSELAACMEKILRLSSGEWQAMRAKSLEIIARWDLDRFSQGATDAIDYALKNKRRPAYFLWRFLLNGWKGRYNPG
jgi:glycosyltransferase involved in cell wall biosynthesis